MSDCRLGVSPVNYPDPDLGVHVYAIFVAIFFKYRNIGGRGGGQITFFFFAIYNKRNIGSVLFTSSESLKQCCFVMRNSAEKV